MYTRCVLLIVSDGALDLSSPVSHCKLGHSQNVVELLHLVSRHFLDTVTSTARSAASSTRRATARATTRSTTTSTTSAKARLDNTRDDVLQS